MVSSAVCYRLRPSPLTIHHSLFTTHHSLAHHSAHAADAACQHAHDVHGEVRHLVDHETKRALIDHRKFAVLLHARGRGARLRVDHRHETDRFIRADRLDHHVADHHLDHARLHDVHAGAGIAAMEHVVAGLDENVGACTLGELAHVDRVVHFRSAPRIAWLPALIVTVM